MAVKEDTPGTISSTTLLANDVPGRPGIIAATATSARIAAEHCGWYCLAGWKPGDYTPPADFAGVDTFFYEVQDNGLSGNQPDPQTATGTVTVTVTNVADAPRIRTALGTRTADEDRQRFRSI